MGSDGSDVYEDPEEENAEMAFEEHEETGSTVRRCLRCGGQFVFEVWGNSYRIRCQNGDYQLTSRGI